MVFLEKRYYYGLKMSMIVNKYADKQIMKV